LGTEAHFSRAGTRNPQVSFEIDVCANQVLGLAGFRPGRPTPVSGFIQAGYEKLPFISVKEERFATGIDVRPVFGHQIEIPGQVVIQKEEVRSQPFAGPEAFAVGVETRVKLGFMPSGA
jgi:hypothetical protein